MDRRKLPFGWHWGWWAALVLVLVVRVVECRQPPTDTSDVYRHIGYGSHLPERGFHIYETTPHDFRREYWTRFWPDQGYIYPPATLVFFSGFGITGLGMSWAKLALTLADLGSALLVGALVGPVAALLVFAAPEAVWYVSHEGQFESLLGLALAATVFFLARGRWLLGGASFMLALQFKQFGVLIAPFLLYEWWQLERGQRLGALLRFAGGMVLAFLPFAGFYLATPALWLRPLQTQGLTYNPFHWAVWDPVRFYWNPGWLVAWNAVWSYASLLTACAFALDSLRKRRFADVLAAGPVAGFWVVVKSLRWAQFWYPVVVPGLAASLYRHRRWAIALLAMHFLQGGRGAVLLTGHEFGYMEGKDTVERFRVCMERCNYQRR